MAKGEEKGAKADAKSGAKAEGKAEKKANGAAAAEAYTARLKQLYDQEIRAKMHEEFEYKNAMQIPRLDKIVLNIGVGEAVADSKKIKAAHDDLMAIAAQKPVITKASKSIAAFKLREGMPIGVKVTLRRARMYDFLDRLVTIAMPRIRDFRGLSSKSFDQNGNFALGVKEHIVFPEIEYDKVDQVWGMDVVICTTAKTTPEAKSLLTHFNLPFVN